MSTRHILLPILFLVIFPMMQAFRSHVPDEVVRLDMEDLAPGTLPPEWKVEATHRRGPLATWQVVDDTAAFSGRRVLALTRTNHSSGSTFNLCWTRDIDFLNGEITVRIRADDGVEDQGGGVIWRARDRNNYYLARYNPLEDNFRIYYVKGGERHMLASARLHLPAHQWFEMKVDVRDDRITAYLNGTPYLDVRDDTFRHAGGVGLWVKADGKTSFDDLTIRMS